MTHWNKKKEPPGGGSFFAFRGEIGAYTVPVTVRVAVPGTTVYAPVAAS